MFLENALRLMQIRLLLPIFILLMMVLNCDCGKKWEPPKVTRYPTNTDETGLYQLIDGLKLKREDYKVATKDGYILCLTRLVLPENVGKKDKGVPVLMVNGLTIHSDAWLVQSNPMDNSAIHWLYNGYDIWLGDQRGTMRSREHKKYNFKKDTQYWDFTFHETGIYDLPAFVDFILRKTGKKKLCYCGLSLGATFGMVMLSEKPEYNKKVIVSILFVPIGDVPVLSTRSLSIQIIFNGYIRLLTYYRMVGSGAVFLDMMSFRRHILAICQSSPHLFIWALAMTTGPGLNADLRYVCPQFAFQYGGSSVTTVLHTFQLFDKGEFRNYDYGETENVKRYKMAQPPLYNYSKITAPAAFYFSDVDEFAPAHVVRRMAKKFGGLVYTCLVEKTHHMESVVGFKFAQTYNPDILAVLDSATGRASDKKLKSNECKL